MADNYRLNTGLLDSINNSFSTEMNSFTTNVCKTFSNSYLSQCSNSIIGTMNTRINEKNSIIESGYSRIKEWLDSYVNDVKNVESALTNNVGSFNEEALSKIFEYIKEKNNANIIDPSDIIKKMLDDGNKQKLPLIIDLNNPTETEMETLPLIIDPNNPDTDDHKELLQYSTMDIESFNKEEKTTPEAVQEVIDYFGEENIESIDSVVDEDNDYAFIYLKNGFSINIFKGYAYIYVRTEHIGESICDVDFETIKNIDHAEIVKTDEIDAVGDDGYIFYKRIIILHLKNGITVEMNEENEIQKIEYNGVDLQLGFLDYYNVSLINISSVENKDGKIIVKLDNNVKYVFSDVGRLEYIVLEKDGQDYAITSIVENGLDPSKIVEYDFDFNTYPPSVFIKLIDGSTIVYGFDGTIKMKMINGKVQPLADVYYDELVEHPEVYIDEDDVKAIEFLYGRSEEWATIYLRLMKSKSIDIYHETDSTIIDLVDSILSKDYSNGYELLHNTPILCKGEKEMSVGKSMVTYKGLYLRYYNEYGVEVTMPLKTAEKDEDGNISFGILLLSDEEVMETTKSYSDFMTSSSQYTDYYKENLYRELKNIYMINYDADFERDYVAYASSSYASFCINNGKIWEDVFHHELGHVFDCSIKKDGDYNRFAESDEWKEIYNQILKSDPDEELLGDYAHSKPSECFAEVMAEYYTTNSLGYRKSDLKEIRINYKGYTNLYDYIDDLVNGRM